MGLDLPPRTGTRPETRDGIPHQQLSQNPDPAVHAETHRRFLEHLPGVVVGPSRISVPGAVAVFVPEGCACHDAMPHREFAHIHPEADGSFHMCLSLEDSAHVQARGWGEAHPYARTGRIHGGITMVYAPRNAEERAVVLTIADASHRFTTAQRPPVSSPG